MATSKLIKPTNVTVSIPEFTDQPDQRVNSDCIDKTIDGVNSLNDQIGNRAFCASGKTSSGTTMSVTLPEDALFNTDHPIFVMVNYRGSSSVSAEGFAVLKYYSGAVYTIQKTGMSNAADFAYDINTRVLTFTTSAAMNCVVMGACS